MSSSTSATAPATAAPARPARSSTRRRTPARDALCAEAVDLARDAALAVAPGQVGDHVGTQVEDDRLVTHLFSSSAPGYRGWHWAVTVVRAPRARAVTVDEVVLLPGGGALLAPQWVPWSERVRPGDLGAGDLLPTEEDDPRLAPGYTGADEDLEDLDTGGPSSSVFELGRGRARVLSREGRDSAARRWYDGPQGPSSPVAKVAPAQCSTCGFLVPLAGALGHQFGVCANEMSPSDGSVVSADHGCGAHSEAVVVPSSSDVPPPILDESGYDVVSGSATAQVGHSAGSVDGSDSEDLGHS